MRLEALKGSNRDLGPNRLVGNRAGLTIEEHESVAKWRWKDMLGLILGYSECLTEKYVASTSRVHIAYPQLLWS